MLDDTAGICRVVIACGYVNLRKGIDGLSIIIGDRYHQNPFEKETLFLFCGRRSDRIAFSLTLLHVLQCVHRRIRTNFQHLENLIFP